MTQKKKSKKRSYKSLYEQCKKWYAEAIWISGNINDKKKFDNDLMVHNWLLEQHGLKPIPPISGDQILIRLVSKEIMSSNFASRIMDISETELMSLVEKSKDQWFVK